jgi:hypothetical protein
MVGACFVGGIEIARLHARLERVHDHARWIRAQMKRLSIQEFDVCQGVLGSVE